MKAVLLALMGCAVFSIAARVDGAELPATAPIRNDRPVYPDVASAVSDVTVAIRQAAQDGRRVLVDFGANWCGDCKVLEANFHRPENLVLLRDHYILVHVNVGDHGIEHNAELASRYGIPLKKGVPALAVLDGQGRVVYSQKNGEFESMDRVNPGSVHQFLLRWRQ